MPERNPITTSRTFLQARASDTNVLESNIPAGPPRYREHSRWKMEAEPATPVLRLFLHSTVAAEAHTTTLLLRNLVRALNVPRTPGFSYQLRHPVEAL